jgi:hypothetical protein
MSEQQARAEVFRKTPSFPRWPDKWEPISDTTYRRVCKARAGRGHMPSLDVLRNLGVQQSGNLVGFPFLLDGQLQNLKILADPETKKYMQAGPKRQDVLFNVDSIGFGDTVFITEGEWDCATLIEHGFIAVSVVNGGQAELSEETLLSLSLADRIFLLLDTDKAGRDCEARLRPLLPPDKTIALVLPDAKDASELCAKDPANFKARIAGLVEDALNRPPAWRSKFHRPDELPEGDIEFLIRDVLPVGISAIGALSGVGKTWLALSMARALTTGKQFVGVWDVPEAVNVLYLCPEMGAKSFRRRLDRFGIKERFFCQTISDGMPTPLDDPDLAAAIVELKPVVFLDTAIRFSEADDENSASEHAKGLVTDIFRLLHLGSRAVVCLHHSPKSSAHVEELTLQNALRGTGDFGAMCDAVWGCQPDRGAFSESQYLKESKQLVRLRISCVKARDFRSPEDFTVQLEPFLDQNHDLAVLTDKRKPYKLEQVDRLVEAITANPKISLNKLDELTGVRRHNIKGLLEPYGWTYEEKVGWVIAAE